MKYNIKSLAMTLCGAGMLMAATSCGDELKPYPWIYADEDEVVNTEDQPPKTIEEVEKTLMNCMANMLNYNKGGGDWAPHAYQYQRSNSIDNYAGYWTTTKANFAFGPALATLYTDDHGYIGGAMNNGVFTSGKLAVHYAANLFDEDGNNISKPEWRALALICQAYASHEMIDFYGAMPFNDWRNVKKTSPMNYENGPEVYKQILADLDEAIAVMAERQPGPGELQKVEGTAANKTITNWDWRYWVKFANSIKLRMALNLVDYNDPDPVYGPNNKPFIAKNIAEEAVNDPIAGIGVLTDADDRDIAYVSGGTWQACVYFMGNSWNDIRLCANLENVLKHFKCPLLETWFDANSYQIKNKVGQRAPSGIYGVRIGLMMEDTGNPDSGGYGPFAYLSSRQQHMDQPFFKRCEALMLMAEGALRGWAMGDTPQNLYERAIRLAFNQWGIPEKADAYLAQTNCPVVDYKDYYNRVNDIAGRVSCSVAWDESDSNELKLEKIISQKYIVNFPMGAEAWTTYRRTGYPRMFPPKYNNHTNVDSELGIRRCTFRRDDNNGIEIDQVTAFLGGTQDAGTHVFWDVNSRSWGKDENGQIIPDNHL